MEIDWKEELLASQSFNKKEEKLLKYGAKSLTDSWYLGALYLRYKKLKRIKDVERPNLQSTYKEFVSKKQY